MKLHDDCSKVFERKNHEDSELLRKLGKLVLDILYIEQEVARGVPVKHWLGLELEVRAAARALGFAHNGMRERRGTEEQDSDCPGHPASTKGPGGVTEYCDGTCRQTIRSWLRSADHRELDRALDDGNDLSPAERKFVLDRLAKMERGS